MSKRAEFLKTMLGDKIAGVDLSTLLLGMDAAAEEDMDGEDKKARDKKAKDAKRAKDRKMTMDAMRAKDGESEEDEDERKAREESDKAEDARRAMDGEEEETEEEREKRYSKDRKAAKDKKARDAKRAKDETDKEKEDKAEDKRAMDAAISAGVNAAVARMNGVREAERVVRPFVGEIVVAMDSADSVYKFALDQLGIDVTGVHPSAYRTILNLQPKPGAADISRPRFAIDSSAANDLFPEARRIGHA
jgi:hypothetical protein